VRVLAIVALAFAVAGCLSSNGGGSAGSRTATAAPEAGTVSGRLTAAQPQASEAIALAQPHGRLAVTLTMSTNLPQDTIVLNVTGGNRSGEARVSPELYVLPSNNPTVAFEAPAVGTWTAKLRLASGAAADYTLDWCADDADHAGPASNKACHHYAAGSATSAPAPVPA